MHLCEQHAAPSPDGKFVATILRHELILRNSHNNEILHTFALPRNEDEDYQCIRWSGSEINGTQFEEVNKETTQRPQRLLIASNHTIRVFEAGNSTWKAVINGACTGVGKITSVSFGADKAEIIVFSDFGVKATIWSLITCRGAEIRDPKPGRHSYDYRLRSGHLAILTRAAAHDTLMLLEPKSHEVVKSVEIPTIDAQGIKWSPDGRWLAIWDTASSGYRMFIFTADGNLFRSFNGGQDFHNVGLGIKTVSWHPNSTYLAIGDFNDRITLLVKDKVIPAQCC